MPAFPRRQIGPRDQVGVYYCIARCARKAFLCGVDPVSGCDNQHQVSWICDRLEQLADFFTSEICVDGVIDE